MRVPFLRLAVMFLTSMLACVGQGSFSSTDIGTPNPPGQTITVANGFDVSSATGDVWGYYWVDPRQWAVYSDQASARVRLEAGRRYYLEALFKGEGSPNHCAVGWLLPDGTYERPIPLTRFRGQPATLRAIGLNAAGRFEVEVGGTLDSLYVVESSASLNTWLPVATNRVPFSFEDFAEEGSPRRFYRARTSQ